MKYISPQGYAVPCGALGLQRIYGGLQLSPGVLCICTG